MNKRMGAGDKYYEAMKYDIEFKAMSIAEKILYRIENKRFKGKITFSELSRRTGFSYYKLKRILNNTSGGGASLVEIYKLAKAVDLHGIRIYTIFGEDSDINTCHFCDKEDV